MDSFIFVENVFLHGNSIIFRKPLLIRGCQSRILVHRNADAFFQIVGKKEGGSVEIFRKVVKIKREHRCLLGNRKGVNERNKLNHL
jgi:hypothetical protein